MNEVKVFTTQPGKGVELTPEAVELGGMAVWSVPPDDADALQTFTAGPKLIVIPQRAGIFHIAAVASASVAWVKIVAEGETPAPRKPWPNLMPAIRSVLGKAKAVGGPVAKYGAMIALGVALTMAPRSCEMPEWAKPRPHPVDPRPAPVDPLVTAIESASTGVDQATITTLAAICRDAATAADNTQLVTAKAYLAYVGGQVQAKVGTKAQAVRKVLDDEIEKSVTEGRPITDITPMTPELRAKAKDAFTRVATALEKAKVKA